MKIESRRGPGSLRVGASRGGPQRRELGGGKGSESELNLGEHLVGVLFRDGNALGRRAQVFDGVSDMVVVQLKLAGFREEDVQACGVDIDSLSEIALEVDVRVEAVEAQERLVRLRPPVVVAALVAEAGDELLTEAEEQSR